MAAQGAAETAKTDAETAKTGAEQAAADAVTNANAVLGYGRIPVGTAMPWFSPKPPNQYWVLITQPNQVFNRATFPQLFDVLAPEYTTLTITSGLPVVTGIGSDDFLVPGTAVEGAGIPAGTTILSVDGASQITLSASATANGTTLRVFPHGNGDGSTTANYPNTAGRVHRGLDTSGTINPDGSGGIETQEDALQHFEDTFDLRFNIGFGTDADLSGVFEQDTSVAALGNRAGNSAQANSYPLKLDPSLVARTASETRAKSFIAPFIIKVADGVDNEASLTAIQVVQDVAANTNAIAVNTAAIAALTPPTGVGQTWQNVNASRWVNTSYQNTIGRPIEIAIFTSQNGTVQASSDNSTWVSLGSCGNSQWANISGIIPDGWYYRLSGGGALLWAELR